MADNNMAIETQVDKLDEQGTAVITEGDNKDMNKDALNSETNTESHHQNEQLTDENTNNSVSSVTHQLEDIHLTVGSESSAPVTHETEAASINVTNIDNIKDKANEVTAATDNTVHNLAHATNAIKTELETDAVIVGHNTPEIVKETTNDVQETDQVKQEVVDTVHAAEEKSVESEHNVQEKVDESTHATEDQSAEIKQDTTEIKTNEAVHNVQEKAYELAASAKEAIISGEKLAEEKIVAAKKIVQEKTHEIVDTVKQTAHNTSVKAQEFEKTAEGKFAEAEKLGEEKFEETKHWLNEKSSEAYTKGSEILGTTQQAILNGATVVTETIKQGADFISTTASNAAATLEQAAEEIKTETTAATNSPATATIDVQGDGKQTLSSTEAGLQSVPSGDDVVTKTDTASTTLVSSVVATSDAAPADASKEPSASATPAQAASATTAVNKPNGPLTAIRNFFKNLFGANGPKQQNNNPTPSSATITKTTEEKTVATNDQ